MKSVTRFNNNFKGTVCLNCNQLISKENNFCPNCGQVNDKNPISVKQYFSEYLSGFFEFDSRFIRTIIPLLFKPGLVTKNYVEGKRKSYVNPFQLYLHITILFFLIMGGFSFFDEFKPTNNNNSDIISQINNDNAQRAFDTIKSTASTQLNEIASDLDDDKISDLAAKIDRITISNKQDTNETDPVINSITKQLGIYIDSVFANSNYLAQFSSDSLTKTEKDSLFSYMLEIYKDHSLILFKGTKDVTIDKWEDIGTINILNNYTLDYVENTFKEEKINYTIPDSHRNSVEDDLLKKIASEKFFKKMFDFMEYGSKNEDATAVDALQKLGYENTYWNIFYYSKSQNINKMKDDPEFRKSYWDNIISKISVALFFLLPIFTLLVALLYIRNKYNYTEHLVFVFHVQTVFFILLIFFMIMNRMVESEWIMISFFLIFLFYLYKALRNFYGQGRFKTIIKFFILNFFFVILSFIGGVVISFLAFLI
jgi:hypothetical protein